MDSSSTTFDNASAHVYRVEKTCHGRSDVMFTRDQVRGCAGGKDVPCGKCVT